MKLLILLVASATASLSLPLRSQEAMTAPQRQVFAAESSFAATMARRDLNGFAAFVSPEAVFFGDTTVLRGKAAVLEGWRRFFVEPYALFLLELVQTPVSPHRPECAVVLHLQNQHRQ